jgi:hypothetical protein
LIVVSFMPAAEENTYFAPYQSERPWAERPWANDLLGAAFST